MLALKQAEENVFTASFIYLSFASWTGCLSEMEVNVRTQKAFVRGYYTVKVSYTIVPWEKKMGLRYLYHGSHDLWPKKRKKTV